MGVSGLMKYISEHRERDQIAPRINLVQQAKSRVGRDKALLLCDYAAVVRVLEDAILKWRQPEFCGYYGCDTRLLGQQFELLIKSLRSIDIEPVFFGDSPTDDEDLKIQEKTRRQVERLERSEEWEKAVMTSSAKPTFNLTHPLCYPVCDSVLKELKVKCLISNCEADVILINHYKQSRNALGILSQDTDLAIADGCRFLPLDFFDFEDAIGFHKGDIKLGGVIKSLPCRYTSRDILSRMLGLQYKDMPGLAMLCGNDYTRPYVKHVRQILGIQYHGSVKQVARWICNNNAQLAIERIKGMDEFKKACKFSMDLYSGKLEFDDPIDISTEKLSPVFFSIKRGTFWQQPVAEAPSLGLPLPYAVSQPIRSTVYALYPCQKVEEYGYHPSRAEGSIRGTECIQVVGHVNLCKARTGLQTQCGFIVRAVVLHHFVNTPLYKLGFNQERIDKLRESAPRDLPPDMKEQEVLRGVIAVSTVAYLASVMELDKNEAQACLLAFAATTARVPGDVDIGKPDPPEPFLRAVALSSTITTILLSLCYIAELLDLAPKVSDIFCSSVFVPAYMAVMKHLPAGTPAPLAPVVSAVDSSHAVELMGCIGTMRSTHGKSELTLRDTLATAIRSYAALVRALALQQQR